jgi:hypothetical protein
MIAIEMASSLMDSLIGLIAAASKHTRSALQSEIEGEGAGIPCSILRTVAGVCAFRRPDIPILNEAKAWIREAAIAETRSC